MMRMSGLSSYLIVFWGLVVFEIDYNDVTGQMPFDVCDLVRSGQLLSLAADCYEVVCTCCTTCGEMYEGNSDTGISFPGEFEDFNFGNVVDGNGEASKLSPTKSNAYMQGSQATHHLRHAPH